jgi:hypothetical protein
MMLKGKNASFQSKLWFLSPFLSTVHFPANKNASSGLYPDLRRS